MRILIVSDLHANPDALAVLPGADATLCAGDLVDFGPDPGAAIGWCRARDAVVVTGNHDYALARGADCGVRGAMRAASVQTRRAHRRMLGDAELAYLGELPTVTAVALDGTTFALAHALPDDVYRHADLMTAGERLLERFPRADVFVLGHTHLQGCREVDGKLFVNPGSVGVASVGGTAHYAVWEDGRVELHGVPYDVEAAVAKLPALGIDDQAFESIADALRHGRTRNPEDFTRG